MSTPSENADQLKQIFSPHYVKERERIQRNNVRFAYYTTAATAFQILKNREIWMRSTMTMNDFSEVDFGLNCLSQTYKSESGQALKDALDACYPNISNEIASSFDSWQPLIRSSTFVTCMSEHVPADDRFGRLSMWRAYGHTAGVALILNNEAMFQQPSSLGVYSSPVSYSESIDLSAQFLQLAQSIKENISLVKNLERNNLKDIIFHIFRFAAVSTKHQAFIEEKEWRIVASPEMHPSNLLSSSIELIGQIPQRVLKIKLEDHPAQNLNGITPDALIERVLIGPCEYPDVIQQSLRQLMIDAGVKNPDTKIHITGIPLRANQR